MFSRRHRRSSATGPVFGDAEVAEAWAQLDAGDVPGALRKLRARAESAPLGEIAQVTGRAAEAVGFDDLRDAAAKVVAEPEDGGVLYDFGYACIERGVGYLAIPALREAVRTHPRAAVPRRELVAAYEDEDRHGEAVDLLLPDEDRLEDWPDRYLLVFDAVTAGRLDLAEQQFAKLTAPSEEMWQPVHARPGRVMVRAAAVRAAGAAPLDGTDLRGWRYVLRGSLLGHLSPYGFDAGMRGRYAYLQTPAPPAAPESSGCAWPWRRGAAAHERLAAPHPWQPHPRPGRGRAAGPAGSALRAGAGSDTRRGLRPGGASGAGGARGRGRGAAGAQDPHPWPDPP